MLLVFCCITCYWIICILGTLMTLETRLGWVLLSFPASLPLRGLWLETRFFLGDLSVVIMDYYCY